MGISFSQNSVVAQPGAQYTFASLVSLTSGNQPEYLVLHGLDIERYTSASNGNHATIAGNGKTIGFTANSDVYSSFGLVFTHTDQGYYNDTYGYLSALTYKSSTDNFRNEFLTLYGFGAAGAVNADLHATLTNSASSVFLNGTLNYTTASGQQASATTNYLGTLDIVTRSGYTDPTPNQATPNEIAAVAATLVGQTWNDNGCWVLANTIAAMAGATLPPTSWYMYPDKVAPVANGEWFVAYNSALVSKTQQLNWPSLLRPGDIVSTADSCGGHVATIVSGYSYAAQVIDNLYTYGAGPDITILPAHSLNIFSPYPSGVVIYRLDAPVVDVVSPLSLAPNAGKTISALFSASDPAGKPILGYQFYDTNSGATGGSFTVNGLAQTAHSAANAINVAASALADTSFVAGSLAGSDSIQVRAYNGSYWGDWQSIPVAVGSSLQPPVVRAVSDTVLAHGGQSLALASLFSVAALDSPVTAYTIWDPFDANASSLGSVRLNGATDLLVGAGKSNTGQKYEVSAADFSKLTYAMGTGSGGEAITVTARNGAVVDSAPAAVVLANASPRTVGISHWVAPGAEIPLSALFFEQTYDTAPIVSYTISTNVAVLSWGANHPSSGGALQLNGAADLWGFPWITDTYQIAAADLDKVTFRAAPDAGQQLLNIWASNGADGVPGTLSLFTVAGAPPLTPHSVAVQAGASIAATTLFDLNPGVAAPGYYRFVDPGGGGALKLSSDASNLQSLADLTPGVVVIHAADLNKLFYVGGYLAGSEKVTISTSNDNFNWSAEVLATVNFVERLQVGDGKVAFDLDGNAGKAAKVLGAVLGPASVSNKQYVGFCLDYLDAGKSYSDLMQAALASVGATTHQAEVNLLWTNLFGSAPSAEQAAPFIAMLDNGTYTPAGFAVAVADHELNMSNIHLIGLYQTGLGYS